MRIAQIVLDDATEYEKKCQRVDSAALATRGDEPLLTDARDAASSGARVAHVYAGASVPSDVGAAIGIPFVASSNVSRGRWTFRRPVEPSRVVSPLLEDGGDDRLRLLPEAVEERYFAPGRREGWDESRPRRIGTFARPAVRNPVEQVLARIHRTRDDVEWLLFGEPPEPADLCGIDLWVDPAGSDSDLDGFVAEALVVGLPVVATRTGINARRLEQGRTGALVPPGDPNEMTHAILAALFKPELSEGRMSAARQTAGKFRSKHRLRVLGLVYQQITE